MPTPDALLARLDAIGRVLAARPDARALIGLGSVGLETVRLDAWSDLDFFVIVEPGAKAAYLDPSLPWLAAAHPLSYVFRNTVDGYKVLFADHIFGEMAVFEEFELAGIPYSPGRIVWKKPGVSDAIATPVHPAASAVAPHDPAYLVGEALTNLYVGLGRELRGERLSATRFIQGQAVDRLIELADLLAPSTDPLLRDGFSPERRLERRQPDLTGELPRWMPGYGHNASAARAILSWLEHHANVAPAMRSAILAFCIDCEKSGTAA